MSDVDEVRRHLYEQYAGLSPWHRRARRRMRRQIALLADLPPDEDGGPSGVREPRRPHPPLRDGSVALPL